LLKKFLHAVLSHFFILNRFTRFGTTVSDVKYILETMHKKSVERDPALKEMMHHIRRELTRDITLSDFNNWVRTYPSLLSPMRLLQTHLRFQIIGPNFWTKMTAERRSDPEKGRFDYLPRLQKEVIARTNFFLNEGDVHISEKRRLSRRGRGPNGDHRDMMTRKQSFLVDYFKVSRFSVLRKQENAHKKVVPTTHQQSAIDEAEEGKAAAGTLQVLSKSGKTSAQSVAAANESNTNSNGVSGAGAGAGAGSSSKSHKDKDKDGKHLPIVLTAPGSTAPRRRRSSLQLFGTKPKLTYEKVGGAKKKAGGSSSGGGVSGGGGSKKHGKKEKGKDNKAESDAITDSNANSNKSTPVIGSHKSTTQ
jgi:hypothetical protein